MNYRRAAVILVLLAGGALWLKTSRNPEIAATSITDPASRVVAARQKLENPSAPPEPVTTEESPEANPNPTPAELATAVPAPPKPATLAAVLASTPGPELAPGLTPATVLENMRAVFRQYSQRLGANPVGVNREITAALNGRNPRQTVFLNPDDGMSINDLGELVDNWGTPFFFHQLSGTEMEIHSAGPDRKMWTADDLVIK